MKQKLVKVLNLGAAVLLSLGIAACGEQARQSTKSDTKGHTMTTNQYHVSEYGTMPDGQTVHLISLTNKNGVQMDVITYGGIVTKWLTKDKNGQFGDIVLGLNSLEDYIANSPYFGALIGRYGNRIDQGKFSLDGQQYQLDINDGVNHLHGGAKGLDKVVWNYKPFANEAGTGVELTYLSPDGEMGYPGNLNIKAIYELKSDDNVEVRFEATTDKATVVNLTQHSYFNLAGGGSILDHQLMINADNTTPVKAGLIPTGEIAHVDGTPFDFRNAKAIGQDINQVNEQLSLGLGYDHNWVVNQTEQDISLVAKVSEPNSGRVLTIYSTEPAVQFYSGNFMDGSISGKGHKHEYRTGFCIEPQHFPDSPNHEHFPSTVLRPGDVYKNKIVYVTSVE